MIHVFKNSPNRNQQKLHDAYFGKSQKLAKKSLMVKIFLIYLVPYKSFSKRIYFTLLTFCRRLK